MMLRSLTRVSPVCTVQGIYKSNIIMVVFLCVFCKQVAFVFVPIRVVPIVMSCECDVSFRIDL